MGGRLGADGRSVRLSRGREHHRPRAHCGRAAHRWAYPSPRARPRRVDLAQLLSLDALRADLARPLRMLVPEPESGILLGIVLGQRGAVSSELANAFAVSGTTHLLAISGFNMTLVGTAVALALRGRARPTVCAVATVAAIVAYSVLVGLSASVMRAALMASVASCAGSGRRANPTRVRRGTRCCSLTSGDRGSWIHPVRRATRDSAVAAPLSARCDPLPGALREGSRPPLRRSPTLPIVAARSGVCHSSRRRDYHRCAAFSTDDLPARGSVGARLADLREHFALRRMACSHSLARTFASLPLAALGVPSGPVTGVVAAVRLVAIARGAPRIRGRIHAPHVTVPSFLSPRSAVLVMPLIIAGGALVWPMADPDVRVRALDVGQGDAYLVELGGAIVLIDGGPDPARLVQELGASLPPWRRRIDVVVLTHAHLDHGAGLLAVLERYEVGTTIEPVG